MVRSKVRKELAAYLEEVLKESSRNVFLTADLGYGVFDELRSNFPKQYYNVGIAEAGMVSIAAGLSAEGFTPYVYSIASFLIPKTYEQVRILSIHNQNKMILVGAGGGFTYSMSGPTHHALDDLSLALLLPNMNVLAPSGPKSLRVALKFATNSNNSSYIQIGKFGEPDFPLIENSPEAKIGLISTGIISNDVYVIAEKLKFDGHRIGVLNLFSLKPLDENVLKIFLEGKTKIIVIEEMWGLLSLYTLIGEFIASNNMQLEVIRIGPEHVVFEKNVERETNLSDFGLSYKNLSQLIRER
jgi:transketolase